MSKKTLYLIHHSHTDIGYTASQEKIKRFHVDFILDVLDILDQIDKGEKEWSGYHYTCENFWQVEEFYSQASTKDIKRFEQRIKEKRIEISLTYLNMNDLVDENQLRNKLAKAKKYLEDLGVEGKSAMIADINGVSWGYSQAMYDNGIRNFFTNVHTHHGMFPVFKKQLPFYWETKKGDKLLVWSGDHYQVANTFFLTPNSEFDKEFPEGYGEQEADAQFAKTEEKIFNYLKNLEVEGYPYDFIPEMISGVITDNSPPNPRMMEIIHRWNEKHGDSIEIVLTSLDFFFEKLRSTDIEIPVYRGDWPDWWADGIGSTPDFVKLYREAQRLYHLSLKLDPDNKLGDKNKLTSAEDNMLMYAEHTWGHAASISHPWESEVKEVDYKKSAYVINAHSDISEYLIEVLAKKGRISPQIGRAKIFKIINPHPYKMSNYAKVNIDHWENVDGTYFNLHNKEKIELVDKNGQVIPSQMELTTRGFSLEFPLTLEENEEKIVRVRQKKNTKLDTTYNNLAITASDNVLDIADYEGYTNKINLHHASTPYFHIYFDENGISSIIDKRTNQEIIKQNTNYNAFQGVYDRTNMAMDPGTSRRILGRNRKGRAAQHYQAKLTDMKIIADGQVFASYSLEYELEGSHHFETILKIYKDHPLIQVSVRIIKNYELRPENLYIALPFQYGEKYVMYAEKAGVAYRPLIDQIPGTNTDFFMSEIGLHYRSDQGGVTVITQDSPLIWIGELKHHQIELFEEKHHYKNQNTAYSWVMNNFWETNFKADTSGAHSFNYLIYLDDKDCAEDSVCVATAINQGFISIPIKEEELK